MKKMVDSLKTFLISIYIIGITFSAPYFIWKDIKQSNSFARYYFISPLIGTAKAFMWPYFIYDNFYNSKKSVDKIKNPSVKFFFNAQYYFNSAVELMNSIKTWEKKEDLERVISLLKATKNSLLKINKMELNNLHEGWGDMVQRNFIKAVDYYIIGINKLNENGDRSDILRGDSYFVKYIKWMKKNWREIVKIANDNQ